MHTSASRCRRLNLSHVASRSVIAVRMLLSFVFLLGLTTAIVHGDTFTVAGFTFDDSLGPTTVVPAPPNSLSDFQDFAFSAQFIPLSNQGNDFDINNSVGIQLLGSNPGQNIGGTSVPLGDAFFQGTLELNWGGSPGVTNNDGDDFVVYENGSPGGPEAYMIAVRETGEQSFTAFRYEFADDFVQVLPSAGTDIAQVLSTGFDLSDFGLAPGATIDAILASNLLPADRVDDELGEGNVILGGGSGFPPLTGPQGAGGMYNSNGFDADLTYIGVIVPPQTVEVGDFDSDNFVSQGDLDLVLLNWADTVLPPGFDENAVIGGGPFDGVMSQNELDSILLNWGNGTPPASAVPEPGAFLLAWLGLLSLAAGRSHSHAAGSRRG